MKRLFYILLLSILFTSCYKEKVPLFGYTKWEYKGDIFDNEITATVTTFNFPTNDTVLIYEDEVLFGKFYYEFTSFTTKGYVKEHDMYFMRDKEDEDNKMTLFYNKGEYSFKRSK